MLAGARVLVLGLGRSGRAASVELSKLGSRVVASDTSNGLGMASIADELRLAGTDVILGPQKESLLADKDLVIVSPGIPSESEVVTAARERDIPVWSEIELAYRLTNKQIIAVTGTNGKTTTTTLIGKIFDAAGKLSAAVGNIGTPLITAATDPSVETLIVEVSSFQLDTIDKFKPHIAVLLNITEDHLDWHPDFNDYVRSKKRIFMNQDENDYAVINIDDDIVRSIVPEIKAGIISTSKKGVTRANTNTNDGRGNADVFVKGNSIFMRRHVGRSEELKRNEYLTVCGIDDLKIPGDHNLDNIMAAIGASNAAGIEIEAIRKAVIGFEGLSHRIEFVASVNRVDYYNDSKATNIDATVKAVNTFPEPVVLMVGGRNKGNSFKPLADCIRDGVKAVVGFGEAGCEILAEIPQGVIKEYAESVNEATAVAGKLAKPGYVVLFSPACASFDAFESYAERGNAFKSAVLSLGALNDN
jgi:UDP-N-acetylmuramoylalanine--D-glutamate ligase